MRIVVIGAGGIGGWLGARLAASGQQVGFLVHDRTLAALRSSGLTLRDCSRGEPGFVTARIETPLASEDPQALTDPRVRALLPTWRRELDRLAPAFEAVPTHRLIHGDAVAPNVILGPDGLPRLIDFE